MFIENLADAYKPCDVSNHSKFAKRPIARPCSSPHQTRSRTSNEIVAAKQYGMAWETTMPKQMNEYLILPIPERCGYEAWQLGLLVHEHSQFPGAHRTPAAEAGNDVLSHAKGKYGELAFHEWLVRQSVTPTHTPFRNDYTRKVLDDDFVVNGLRLEIKTKMRKVSSPFPPPVHFNVNLGKKEIEDAIHVFIELSSKVKIVDNPAAIIVGWAPPALIADKGVRTWPGKESDNKAFTFKRYDWDLNIRDLLPPAGLIKAIGGARR